MSVKKIKQVKAEKGFKILDIAVYLTLLAAIIALFIAFVFTADRSALRGVNIKFVSGGDEVTAFSYSFEDDAYEILSAENIKVISDGEKELVVRFFLTDENRDFNEIFIDKEERSARVRAADCANNDCVLFGKITDNSHPLTCKPHGHMVVEPFGYKVSGDEIN